jgi:hypothetical protein
MSGLLKFLAAAGLLVFLIWAGYGFFSRPDVQQHLQDARQGSMTAPIAAGQNLGQAIRDADDRAAQQIKCAGRSDC